MKQSLKTGGFPSLEVILQKVGKDLQDKKILAFDPGEMTGWAVMQSGALEACGQIATTTDSWTTMNGLETLIKSIAPEVVVYETYRVYDWKSDDHKWSEIMTLQNIGVLKYFLGKYQIPHITNLAATAKGFVTDNKLMAWGFWQKGERHARDAIRHAVYTSIFDQEAKLLKNWT